MGVHKIIEPGGEQYLPFALSKLRQLAVEAANQYGTANRVVYADSGAVIRLRVDGSEQHLHITAGGGNYQFTSTGPAVKFGRTAGLPYDLPLGYGVKVGIVKGKVKSVPLGSTVEADTEDPPRWPYSSIPSAMDTMLVKKSVWQVQHVSEHVYYPRKKGGAGVAKYPFLVSCWAPSTSVLGVLKHSSVPHTNGGQTDLAYDAAPSLFRGGGEGEPLGGSGLAPDADWYRRAATCVVDHPEYGSRRFIVLVSADNKFHVYPTSSDIVPELVDDSPYQAQQIKTNVPEKFVKRAAAPMPGWCRQSGLVSRDAFADALTDPAREGRYVYEVPQYLWEFDSACTKACCVVFEDLEQPEGFNFSRPIYLLSGDGEVHETLPGLLELGIDIALTGKEPEEFTFGLRVLQALRPSLDGRYFLGANYSWMVPAEVTDPPPEKPPPNTADLDDLIVITGHVYHTSQVRSRFYEPIKLNIYAGKGILRVRNLTKNTTVRKFVAYANNQRYMNEYPSINAAESSAYELNIGATESYTASSTLVAYDLRILAFAVQQRFKVNSLGRYLNGEPDAPGSMRQAQRLQVYAYNKLAQEKYLDPGHPLNPRVASAHADVSTDHLFEFPCNDIGVFETNQRYIHPPGSLANPANNPYYGFRWYQSAYWYLVVTPLLRPRYTSSNTSGWYSRGEGPFHAGALLYAQMVLPAVAPELPVVHDKFAVHPDGSWSLVTAPFFYYAGGTDVDEPWPSRHPMSVDAMRQGRIDIICLRKGSKKVMTTHLECLNEAYGKKWKEEDFLYRFSILNRAGTGGRVWVYLGIHLANDPATGAPREAFVHCSYDDALSGPEKRHAIDARRWSLLYKEEEAQAFSESDVTLINAEPGGLGGVVHESGDHPATASISEFVPFSGASALFF